MRSSNELIVEPIGLDVEKLSRPIRWQEMFGNDHPVELEIGMGKANFLTEQARAHPEIDFFGIEYARWFWRYGSDRLRRNCCLNVRTVRAEAAYFLKEFVADATLSVVHIYFPDPWPKTRHHKRRLIQRPFLLEIDRVLKPGGRLQVVSDHQEYFAWITQAVAASPLKPMEYPRPESAGVGEIVGTNFERKYRRQGRPFFALAARRGE